jgi:hypothetical protein
MAKSFKQLPAAGTGVLGKVLSERDFFDLTEAPLVPTSLVTASAAALVTTPEPQPGGAAVDPAGPAATLPPAPVLKLPTSTPSKRPTRRSTGNTSLPDKPAHTGEPGYLPAEEAALTSAGVRQTFVVGEMYLERLRDYVHDRRLRGNYLYSQRQALQEALDLFFASKEPVAPRPASLREQEQHRRVRIREGRRPVGGG